MTAAPSVPPEPTPHEIADAASVDRPRGATEVEQTVTFVVRVAMGEVPDLRGTVERVRTKEKHRFEGLDILGRLMAQMTRPPLPEPDTCSGQDS